MLNLRTWDISWTFPASVERKMLAAFANEKSKLVNIKGRRIGALDARAEAVISLLKKIGSRIESFTASHMGYATMGGPESLLFAEKCWTYLNPQAIKNIAINDRFSKRDVALRLFRSGCPRLEKIEFTFYADLLLGLEDVLTEAEFPRLRIIKLALHTNMSRFHPFIQKNRSHLVRVYGGMFPDPVINEVPDDFLHDRLATPNPLDLEALNATSIEHVGVPIQKIMTLSKQSVLGAYIFYVFKSTVATENLAQLGEFFKANFVEQYPCENSFIALQTLAHLLVKAQGADKSFIALVVDWTIPYALDHKNFKHESTLWSQLHHASSYHNLEPIAEKCFAPLQALIESSDAQVNLFDFSQHHYTFERLLKQPNAWIERHTKINQAGSNQFARLMALHPDNSAAFLAFVNHDLFDPNLACNTKGNRTVLHELVEAFSIDSLLHVGLSLWKRIEKFDKTILKLPRTAHIYQLRRIFENDDLISLFREVVSDWRRLIDFASLKDVPNALLAFKFINFIDSYPTKLTEEQKTFLFEAVWKNAILKSYNEDQLTNSIKLIIEYFPGRETPKFIKESLKPTGPVKIGESKAPLEYAVIERVFSGFFKTQNQEGCTIA